VRIDFVQGENPYAEKKPKRRLTPRKSAIARRTRRISQKKQQRRG
jgi:hypothetical protein